MSSNDPASGPPTAASHELPATTSALTSAVGTPANSKSRAREARFDWHIDSIVAELRQIRDESLSSRSRSGHPSKLPSLHAITSFLDAIQAAMFPNRLGNRQLTIDSVDYFVGHTLDLALDEMVEQVARELRLTGNDQLDAVHEHAVQIVRLFAAEIPAIRRLIESDLRAAFENDPAARTVDEVLICFPGVAAIIHHRIAHAFHQLGAQLIARIIARRAHSLTAIDIHPAARIKDSFYIDTGTGVVIGETVVIGQRVRLYHGVTLGSTHAPRNSQGAVVKGTPRHPIIEDDVTIHSGATIVGRVIVGRGSTIGCNVWLDRSVAPGSNLASSHGSHDDFDAGLGI